VDEILGPFGRLAKTWSGYEHRPGQLHMAEEVARAFETNDFALIEAGTGTGKTMAYLVPALLSGRKTVVSTGTKNLQDQILEKDVPFIRRRLGAGFRAVRLKGRENYLCLFRYQTFVREPTFVAAHETLFFDRLREWAESTHTGDRAELVDLPDDFMAWSDLSSPGDRCLGGKCPHFGDCFLQRARKAAAAADLVVVNHHLFMADLAVRGGGFGEVIPDYQAAVFDEAHQLEGVATQYFGMNVSSWRLAELKRDAELTLVRTGGIKPGLGQVLLALGHQADTLARSFLVSTVETELWLENDPEMDRLRTFGGEILATLGDLAARLEPQAEKDEEIQNLASRAAELGGQLGFILEGMSSDYVYWSERRGRGLFLRASPIKVAPFLQERLYSRGLPLVFTSATLATQRSFDYFKERLGLYPELEGAVLDSPFDYARQTLLYIPRAIPEPGRPDYPAAMIEEIERLLRCSRGRAFVLFTSYRHLKLAEARLFNRLDWPCLVQGQAPKSVLLERFRKEIDSVLLATHSFWQGVDVPGESLSAVIVDKLPFTPPDRPLFRARSRKLKEEGQDPFMTYQVPEAIITLKQGLGRLIRSTADRGLLAVLDTRLITKRYGRLFLDSLPPSPLTHDMLDVERFFGQTG